MGATIGDVANLAQVSKATVSRYLNSHGYVSSETAEKINKVIQELNYIPSSAARSLVLKKTYKIGVLTGSIVNSYWALVYEGIMQFISKCPEPYEAIALSNDGAALSNASKSIRDKLKVLAEERVDGIILAIRDSVQNDEIDYLLSLEIPFVIVQGNAKDPRVSSVNVDNFKAFYEATAYLIGLGHKDIACVSGSFDAEFAKERFEGYRMALSEKARNYRKDFVLFGNNQFADGYWRTKQILSWKKLPTAIIYVNDNMAYGGIKAIFENGMLIPDDLSVVGFDGFAVENEIFQLMPPLTTVHQPSKLIGEKAAEILLKKIRDKANGKSKSYTIHLPTEFIDNGSCKRID